MLCWRRVVRPARKQRVVSCSQQSCSETRHLRQTVRALRAEANNAHTARRWRAGTRSKMDNHFLPSSETARSKTGRQDDSGGWCRCLGAFPTGLKTCWSRCLFQCTKRPRTKLRHSSNSTHFWCLTVFLTVALHWMRSRRVDIGTLEKVWHGTQNTVDTCVNCTISRPHHEPTRAHGLTIKCLSSWHVGPQFHARDLQWSAPPTCKLYS